MEIFPVIQNLHGKIEEIFSVFFNIDNRSVNGYGVYNNNDSITKTSVSNSLLKILHIIFISFFYCLVFYYYLGLYIDMDKKLLIIFINGKPFHHIPYIGDYDEVFLLGSLSGKGNILNLNKILFFIHYFYSLFRNILCIY